MENVEVKFIGDVSSLVKALDAAEKKLKELEKPLDDTGKKTQTLGEKFSAMRDFMQGPVAAFQMVVAAIAKVYQEIDKAIMAAAESQAAFAKVSSTLKATGYAAGVMSTDIIELSNSMANATLFEDEDITNAQAILLTFDKIGKKVFPDVMKISADLSTVLGTDLQSSVRLLGKALQDPIEGSAALVKAGIRLGAAQKKQIEDFMAVNDLASAQGIILKELEGRYGGASQAVADTATGSWQQLKKELGEVNEAFGKLMASIADTAGMKTAASLLTRSLEGIASLESIKKLGASKVSIEELGAAISYLRKGVEDYDSMSPVLKAMGQISSYGSAGREVEAQRIQLMKLDAEYEKRRLAEWMLAKSGKAISEADAIAAVEAMKLAEAQAKATEAQAKAAEAAKKLAEEIEKQYKLNYAKQLEDIASALGFVSDQAKNATVDFTDLNESMGAGKQDSPIKSTGKAAQMLESDLNKVKRTTNDLSSKIKDLGSEGGRALKKLADAAESVSGAMFGLLDSMASLAMDDPFAAITSEENQTALDAAKTKLKEMEDAYAGMSEEYKAIYLPTLQAQRDIVKALEDQIAADEVLAKSRETALLNLGDMGTIAQGIIGFITSGFTDLTALTTAFNAAMALAYRNDPKAGREFSEKLVEAAKMLTDAFEGSGAITQIFALMGNVLDILIKSGLLKSLLDVFTACMYVINLLLPVLKPIFVVVSALITIVAQMINAIGGILANIVNAMIDVYNASTWGTDYGHVALPVMPPMPALPSFASGVFDFSGGAAIVGEQGPELVTLPAGANVYPADKTASMLNKSATVNIYSPKALDAMSARTIMLQTMRRMAAEGVM